MISDIVPVNSFRGDNNNTKFDFDFLINSESELKVLYTDQNQVQTELELNKDYTINEIKNENGSYIIFPISGSDYGILKSNETISLMLNIPIAQTTPFGTSAVLNLNSLEFALDYIVRLIQMISRQVERSVKIQEGSKDKPEDYFNYITTATTKVNEYANNAQEFAEASESIKEQCIYLHSEVERITENFDSEITETLQTVDEAKAELVLKKDESVSAINTQKENVIKEIAEETTVYVDKSKQWATSENEIEEGLYSSKYYSELAAKSIPDNFTTLPIGAILSVNATEHYTPSGCVPCDGREFKKEDFKQLWNNYLTPQKIFDGTYLTLTGNPKISENGIASNISVGNFITATVNITEASELQITTKFNYVNSTSSQVIYWLNNCGIRLTQESNGAIAVYSQSGTVFYQAKTSFGSPTEGDEVYAELAVTPVKAVLKLTIKGMIYTFTKEELSLTLSSTLIGIGSSYYQGNTPFSSTIDLKDFSVTVNGIVIFDCVTDGLYLTNSLVVKQENPSIKKGRAYNFTNADYLHFTSDFLVNNGYGICVKLKMPTKLNTYSEYVCTYNSIINGQAKYYTEPMYTSELQVGAGNNWYFRVLGFTKDNTDLVFNYQVSLDGETWLGNETVRNYGYYDKGFSIGADNYWSSETKKPFSGSIDLTESYLFKYGTDEKIYLCDVLYHSRLNTCSYSAYEKELKEYGQCAKFAVQEFKFKLPTISKRYLVASKQATEEDNTWFNLYSDGWCEQGGIATGGNSNTGNHVNLIHTLKDNYMLDVYVLGDSDSFNTSGTWVKTRAITNSSFYIASGYTGASTAAYAVYNCSWEAKGYVQDTPIQTEKTFIVIANGYAEESLLTWNALLELENYLKGV